MPVSRFETVSDRTYDIKTGFEAGFMKALRKACFDIQARAQINITDQDAVDTGALRSSVYTVTPGRSGYAAAESKASAEGRKGSRKDRARARKQKRTAKGAREVEMLPEETVGPLEGVVAVGVEYGAYVEFGTVFMPPRAFFGPAAEDVLAEFEKVVCEYINKEIDR